ncbi:MAG: VOC family protein [Planctomycetales bacterium]
MLRHVAGMAEIVEDVNVALKFYRDVLGLEVKQQDGDDYAIVNVPGVLHFGVWNRAHAAECTYGDREQANRIPLGFTLEFEVDDAEVAAKLVADHGGQIAHAPRMEPWGQKTFRMILPGGGLLGFAETPWGRVLSQDVKTAPGDPPNQDE